MNDTDLTHTTGTRKFFLAWKKRQNKISIISLMSSRRGVKGSNPVTMSQTQYDWRKIEQVTMKANFNHFWCAESEFMVKNEFHNWTSCRVRVHLAHIRKIRLFWLFLSAPVQAISVNNPQFICSSWLLPVLKCWKRAKFSKNVPNAPYLQLSNCPIMKLFFDYKFRFYT